VDNPTSERTPRGVAHNWSASDDNLHHSIYYPFRCTSGTSTSRLTPVMSKPTGQTANRRSTVSVLRQQAGFPRWKSQSKTVLCMGHRKTGRINTSCWTRDAVRKWWPPDGDCPQQA